MRKLLVTGGAGFIGSNYVRYVLNKYPDYHVTVIDSLTYAGNLDNLADLSGPRMEFVKGDIRNREDVDGLIRDADAVINFAAESFVDRSILEPDAFITTDVLGTHVLLEAARKHGIERFVHISTDEVYGDVEEGSSTETDPFRPNSPYSASKAGGDLLVRSYYVTYKLPVMITRGSNTYGPYQHPEKLIPLFITNAIDDKPLPLYGDGQQVRDWLYVMDHCSGIDLVLHKGTLGEAYNIGGGNERTNIQITYMILKYLGKPESLIKHVTDRPGHDRRYSIATTKLKSLGWQPEMPFEDGLKETVEWYQTNQSWWRKIKEQEEYKRFAGAWYEGRKE
ncbi:MAG TPA: dTDP-glucose 4,6-dehydratase [Armatimonadota bacterium]|mgnify:FL=1|nr:dTDP-glucose 4,6-dehydratase [Armatimonadota bacterium]HOP81287.1 dTDP-glucose 4,6-dehydratase [Armatimonadota bacterium]